MENGILEIRGCIFTDHENDVFQPSAGTSGADRAAPLRGIMLYFPTGQARIPVVGTAKLLRSHGFCGAGAAFFDWQ